jgi:predicted aminopeptidase
MTFKPVLLGLLFVLSSACSPFYVMRAGYEEAKILARRQPIHKLVDDASTPPATRGKLALVLEAREFAAEELKLDAGKSYTTFSQLDSDTLALVLSAAHKDRFEAHTWWFPIVGHVPYKGFFSESKAQREIRKLERKGFDTYLRPTSAFSTLGWFNDPMVSALLRYDSIQLANTVIHELFHNTFYAAGQAMFNESLATFAGGRGAIEFFCRGGAVDSPQCQRAQAAWQDDLVFGRFLSALATDLEALYARDDLTSEQKIAAREIVFEQARREFAEHVRPQLRETKFASFDRAPLNNATLISRRLYYGRLDLFEEIFQRYGGNLTQTLEAITAVVRDEPRPYEALEEWLGAERPPRPSLAALLGQEDGTGY